MTTFYISDTHFNHEKIIKLANRPFKDVDEMNRAMINNWNSVVNSYDDVFHLGDFAWSGANEFFNQLNGRKYIIWGNHDENAHNLRWFYEAEYYELQDPVFGKIVLFHYPILEWNGMFKSAYHFYGHVHNGLNTNHMPINWKARAFDVGVEALEYFPRTAEEIIMKGNR